MTTYFTDFSEYTAGSPPSDWTARGTTTSSTWTAETGGDDKILKHTLGTSAQRWVSWNDLDGDANRDNVELLGLIYNDGLSSTQNGGGLWVRGSDSSGIYAYNCAIRSDKLRLAKYIAGTATTLSDFAGTFSAATWYWVRFRVNGTSLKARIWADGGSEPGTWDIDTTNGDVTGVGWAGASNGNASADPSFELFGVGTNGDTAPSSAGGGGATGTGALSAQSSTVAGTATRNVTGVGTPSSQSSTVSGTAEREITSSGTPTAQSSTVSGNGSVSAGISGSGSLSAQSATVAGTATRTVTASGSPAAQSAAVAGTAEREITGTGTPAAQASTVAGTGQVGNIITGSGTPAAQSATVAGTAERTVTGSGSPAAQASTVAGTGVRTITGSGAVAANDSTVYGYDTAPVPSGDTGGGGSRRVLIRERKVREEVDEWLAKKAEQDLLRKIQREDEEITLIMALVA